MEIMKKTLVGLIALVIVMFTYALYLTSWKIEGLSQGLFISIFQFLLIGLIGGIASMMLKSYQSEIKKHIKYRKDLSDVSNLLVKHYNETKKLGDY